jgi:hypothetical protein
MANHQMFKRALPLLIAQARVEKMAIVTCAPHLFPTAQS